MDGQREIHDRGAGDVSKVTGQQPRQQPGQQPQNQDESRSWLVPGVHVPAPYQPRHLLKRAHYHSPAYDWGPISLVGWVTVTANPPEDYQPKHRLMVRSHRGVVINDARHKEVAGCMDRYPNYYCVPVE